MVQAVPSPIALARTLILAPLRRGASMVFAVLLVGIAFRDMRRELHAPSIGRASG